MDPPPPGAPRATRTYRTATPDELAEESRRIKEAARRAGQLPPRSTEPDQACHHTGRLPMFVGETIVDESRCPKCGGRGFVLGAEFDVCAQCHRAHSVALGCAGVRDELVPTGARGLGAVVPAALALADAIDLLDAAACARPYDEREVETRSRVLSERLAAFRAARGGR